MSPHGIDLDGLTRAELRKRAPSATVVLPLASTEQHGPHLALATDRVLAERVARAAAGGAAEQVPVLVAPALAYGSADHHRFAGALSLSAGTLAQVLVDLLRSLALAGVSRVFLVNGHGGNTDAMRLAAKDVVNSHRLTVASCNYWDVAANELVALSPEVPGHAGHFETSLMLAVAPDLVRADLRPDHAVGPPALFAAPPATGISVDSAGEWERVDGYTDASADASAETGRRLYDAIVGKLAEAIVAFHRDGRVHASDD